MNPTETHPLAAVWQLATGTQLAALELSVRPGTDDDLALTGVALALATVIDALETGDPHLAERTVPDTTEATASGRDGIRAALDQLLTAARDVLDVPGGGDLALLIAPTVAAARQPLIGSVV